MWICLFFLLMLLILALHILKIYWWYSELKDCFIYMHMYVKEHTCILLEVGMFPFICSTTFCRHSVLHVEIAPPASSEAAYRFICWDGFTLLWEVVFSLSIYT